MLSYLTNFLFLLLFVAAGAGAASGSGSLSVERNERDLLEIQRKVDELFQQKEYERALFIYEHELAPLGDKYAQYMIGFMYLTGAGVNEDPVRASAWYRLAAERGNREFSVVRDELMARLPPESRQQSDQIYRELRQQYSDIAILVRQIRKERDELKRITGSYVGETGSVATIVDPHTGETKTTFQVRREFRASIEDHLKTLDRLLPEVDVETNYTRLDLDALEAVIAAELARLPEP